MGILYEFLPLILFLVALLLKDIYVAVMVLMITMPIGLLVKYLRTRKLDRMYFWSTVAALALGAATLYFRNPKFLFWKPTVFYWALAAACLISQWATEAPIVQRMFGMVAELNTQEMTARDWSRLNLAWTIFFTALGFLNLYVAYNYSVEFWGTFKVFGLFGITLVFIVAQSIWVANKLGDDAVQVQDSDSNQR
jgi:intracellular septation protein